MKSILFVIHQTGTKGNGGVQSITNILQQISSKSKVYVLTQQETSFNSIWEKSGIQVIYLPDLKNKVFNFIRKNIFIAYFLIKNKITTVHCNDIQSLFLAFIGVKFTFRKLIYNKRAVKPSFEKYSFKWKVALSFVDHVIVLSKDMQNRVVGHFPFLSKKISFSYSIVDFEKFKFRNKAEVRKELGLPLDKIIFGIVARFEDVKQQDLFISNCLNQLNLAERKELLFCMIGDIDSVTNNFAQKCISLVEKHDLEDCVKFYPYQLNIEEWYSAFDFTLVVSIKEGLARCMIESISCGIPVISFDVSSATEILNHERGVVVPQNNFDELLKEILNQKSKISVYDENNIISYSREAFSLTSSVEHYLSLYV